MKLTTKLLAPILALSIGHSLQAVPFNANVQNGNWSDMNSWDLVLVPDTYLGDTANILGFTIDYDSGTTLTGGGLGIANGGSLTIDGAGSVLTQTVSIESIRVGEGSGGVGTGVGTLTLQNGGAMITGLAAQLLVGSQNGAGGPGMGLVDIINGTLTLGATTLRLGADPTSTGTVNVGGGGAATLDAAGGAQILVGDGGIGYMNINSGGIVNYTSVHCTGDSAGTGTTVILAGGQLVGVGAGARTLMVGQAATGTFNTAGTVSNAGEVRIGGGGGTATFGMTGGTLTATGEFNIGRDAGTTGTATLSSGVITVGGQFNVGRDSGQGTFTMTGGSVATSGQFVVGQSSGAANLATISAGTVTSANEMRVGEGTGGVGALSISGSAALTSGGEFQVGNDAGTGTVNMSGGTLQINQWGAIGRSGGTGTLNFSGGTIQMGGGNRTFDIGVFGGNGNPFGTGTMNQTGGSLINTTNNTNIGRDGSGVGIWNISAGSATLHDLVVGNGGNGTLNVSGTGSIDTQNGWMFVGNGNGAVGVVNQSGGIINNTAGWFSVASNADGATGTLNQTGGVHNMDRLMVASNGGVNRNGTVNVSSGTFNNTGWTEIGGGNASNTGTLNVSGTGVVNLTGGQDAMVGYNGGTGILNVTGGGTLNANWWLNIGRGGTANGTALVSDAGSKIVLTNRGDGNGDVRFNIGGDPNGSDTGTGTLTISNGGAVNKNSSGGEWNVGVHATSVGVVTVNSGGTLTNQNGDSFIGRDGGTGTVNVSGAGSIVSTTASGSGNQVHVGIGAGSTGTVNISAGGAFTTNQGWFGIGQDSSTGVVTVNGTGSSLTTHGLIVGWSGTGNGTLNIQNGAVVTNNTPGGAVWELSMGRDGATSTGTVNITTGGTLNAGRAFRIGANGFGTVNINAGTFNGSAGDWAYIGDGGSSHGTVNMTNGSFTLNDSLMIANNNGAHGTFTQDGAASNTQIGNELNIGRSGGIGVVNVNGGLFQVNGWTTMGRDGNNGSGVINVTNGGEFRHQVGNNGDFLIGWTGGSSGAVNVNTGGTVNYSWWTRVAVDGGSTGAITVDGATSNWNNTGGRVFIGESGTGTLNITNGGQFTMTNADWFVAGGNDGANSKGNGTVTISGAGSSLTSNNFLAFGRGRVDALNLATGTLNMTSGSISSSGSWIGFGTDQGQGTANISGTATGTSAGETIIGRTPNSIGTFNLSGNAVWTSGGEFQVGNNGGLGVANISGGTLNLLSYLAIGRNQNDNSGLNGGNGTLNLSGTGVINKVNNNGTFDIGSWNGGNNATTNTTGTLVQTGGTINNTVSDTHIGRDTGVVGTWNITAGTATLARLNIGNSGFGTLNMSGGIISASDRVSIAANGGSTGTANLNGGVITTQFVEAGGGTAVFNMNGGTLRAFGNEGDFLRNINPANSEIMAGGVIFDSNTFAITANNTFDGVGGMTKIGNGILTLTAPNLHTGVIQIDRGTLQVNAIANNGVAQPLGQGLSAILIGSATPGTLEYTGAGATDLQRDVTVNGAGGGILKNSSASTLTLSGTLTKNGNTLTLTGTGSFMVNGLIVGALPGSDLVVDAGNATLTNALNSYAGPTRIINGGTLTANSNGVLGAASGGVFISEASILKAGGNLTTAARTVTLGTGGGTIDTNGNTVTLNVGSTVTGTSLTEADSTLTTGILNIKGTAVGLNALTTTGGVTNLYTALGTGTSTITANATTNIYASQTLASLTIANGVEVTFGDGLPFAPEPPKASVPFGGGVGLVPEPGSIGLLVVGALGILARRRRTS